MRALIRGLLNFQVNSPNAIFLSVACTSARPATVPHSSSGLRPPRAGRAVSSHQEDDISGVTTGHEPVKMSVDIICLAFPYQLVGDHAAETRHWLCAKPGIGRQL